MQEYIDLFSKEGYSTEDDVENLKDLKLEDLQRMGIHKRGEACKLSLFSHIIGWLNMEAESLDEFETLFYFFVCYSSPPEASKSIGCDLSDQG